MTRAESLPERVERIQHEQHVGFATGLRVALAEQRIEQRVAQIKLARTAGG